MSRLIRKIIKDIEQNINIDGDSINVDTDVVIDGHHVVPHPYNGFDPSNPDYPSHDMPESESYDGPTGEGGKPIDDYTYTPKNPLEHDVPIVVRRRVTEVITDFSSAKLQEYQNAGGIPYAIYKNGTKRQVEWSDVREIPKDPGRTSHISIAQIANAASQNFWTDDDGAHVTSDLKNSWQEEYNEPDHGTLSTPTLQNPWHNILINSLGILLRRGLLNLAGLSKDAIVFYDGSGNTDECITAVFGSSGAQIGKNNENHLVLSNTGVSAYDSNGELIPVNASNISADHAKIEELDAGTAKIQNGIITNAKIDVADVNNLSANYAHLKNGKIDNATIDAAKVNDLSTNYAHITNGVIDNADINVANVMDISANYAHITDGVIDNAEINVAKVIGLEAAYASIEQLNAQGARIDNLITIDISGINAKIENIESDYITTSELEAATAVLGELDVHYAKIDLANVNNAWIQDGIIVDGSITDAKIQNVSANKLTAGTIDASEITVTNLKAEDILVNRINGQAITGKSVQDILSDQAGDIEDLDNKIDDAVNSLNSRIDAQIQTWTVDTVPTLNNTPANTWTTNALKDEHIGDICYVVNSANEADGYTYRFAYDNTTKKYGWILIKDNQVTAALQRLLDAEGDISGLQEFQTDTTSWISNTDAELISIKNSHTTLATKVDKTLVSTTQLWFTKANTTAPAAPKAHVTTNNINTGNAWNIAVPAYNTSYPNYFYCYEWQYADETYGWSGVTRDIAMGETQLTARTAKATAETSIKSSVQLWFTKANTTAPNPPTTAVTSTATTGNAWTTRVPVYNKNYPNYFYCYQYQKGDNSYTWSDVIFDSAMTEAQSTARTVTDNLATYITNNNKALSDLEESLQSQIDGQVDIWYGAVEPTVSNSPASDWADTDTKSLHVGDLYYNTENGHSWRWIQNGSNYSWVQIPDSDTAAALKAAQDAQTTADGKRRVFTSTPTVPYDIGDLWVDGTTVKYANKKRTSGSYTASEWSLTATDDTLANAVKTTAETALAGAVEYIVGTHGTAATNAWTGATRDSVLTTGKTIAFKMTSAGTSTAATLNLTLADGTTTGAKQIRRNDSTVTTQFAVGTVLSMTYDGTYWRITGMGSDTTTNTYDRTKYAPSVTANGAIAAARIGVFNANRKLILLSTVAFDISMPILYIGTAYTTSALTQTNNYTFFGAPFDLTLTHAITGAEAGKMVFIVGTLNSNMFTPNSTVLTCTTPTSEDGLIYISLGMMSTDKNAVLEAEHSMYAYRNGAFQRLDISSIKLAENAQTTANTAKATAEAKRRIFTSTPTVPYDIGDLWVNGSEVKYSTKARTTGSYTASDWVLTATDDSLATAAKTAAENAQAAVDNLQIGGRNLLLKTENLDDTAFWGRNRITSVEGGQTDPDGGSKAYLITPETSAWYLLADSRNRLLADVGSTFIFSVWLKADNDTTCNLCGRFLKNEEDPYSNNAIRRTVNVTTEWRKFYFVAALLQSQTDNNLWIGQKTAEPIYIYHPKLEFGNKATDWTPAPEDIDGDISNVLTIAENAIVSTTQLWFTKASDSSAPTKPTMHVTTNDASKGNIWNIAVPTYNASYPFYYYCYEYLKGDGGYSWSNVVYDRATSENQLNARNALTKVATKVESSVFNTLSQEVEEMGNTITSLSTEVSNIEVGGRNLISGYSENDVVSRTGSTSTYVQLEILIARVLGVDEYVLSFEAKADVACTINSYWYSPNTTTKMTNSDGRTGTPTDGNSALNITTEWKKHWVKWTQSDTADTTKNLIVFRIPKGTTATVDVRRIKFETGNTPTAWTPAPKDMATAASVTTVSNTVNSVKQTTESNSSTISNLTTRLGTNSDGTENTNDIVKKVSDVTQDLNTFKTNVSTTYTTKTNFDNEVNQRKATYVTSTTGASTAAKVGVCANFVLYTGAQITCTFSNANTAATPTLNVNSTGAKQIRSYTGLSLSEQEYKWVAGSAIDLVYDGTYWRLQDSGISKRMGIAETSISQQADAIALRATKDEVYQNGKPNLSPWFSRTPYQVNDYWIGMGLGSTMTATYVGDGWVRIQSANSSSSSVRHDFYVAKSPAVEPNKEYTWLFEFRNNRIHPSGNDTYVYIVQRNDAQFWDASGARLLKPDTDEHPYPGTDWTAKIPLLPVDENIIYTKRFVKLSESGAHWTNNSVDSVIYLANINVLIAAGDSVDFELRISLYEGEYTGPYKPYSGVELYASQAELKIANDSISTKVETNGVISAINQSAESVTIDANKININGIITAGSIAKTNQIPTKTSQLTNDSNFGTTEQISTAKSEAISAAATDASSKVNAVVIGNQGRYYASHPRMHGWVELGYLSSKQYINTGVCEDFTKDFAIRVDFVYTIATRYCLASPYAGNPEIGLELTTDGRFRIYSTSSEGTITDKRVGTAVTPNVHSTGVVWWTAATNTITWLLISENRSETGSYTPAGTFDGVSPNPIYMGCDRTRINNTWNHSSPQLDIPPIWYAEPDPTDKYICSWDLFKTVGGELANVSDISSILSSVAIDQAIDGINIGGRNFLKNSGDPTKFHTNTPNVYLAACIDFVSGFDLVEGNVYTVQIWATNSGRNAVNAYIGGGSYAIKSNFVPIVDGDVYFEATFVASANMQNANNFIDVYASTTGGIQGSTAISGTFQVLKAKLEIGNKATDWTPAPEDVDTKIEDVSSYIDDTRAWYANCPTAAATAAKVATITPATTKFKLQAGATVHVKFDVTNSTNTALTLNVNGTGAKSIKYIYNNTMNNIPSAGYLVAGFLYQFVYDGTYWVIQNFNYNTNNTDRTNTNNNLTIKSDPGGTWRVMCGDATGYVKVAANVEFNYTYPILSFGSRPSTYPSTVTTGYSRVPSLDVTNTGTIQSGAANKMLYLKGTISGSIFKIAASNFFTTVIPTSADGYFYMPLGIMYSAAGIYFDPSKDLYAFVDGGFRQVTPTEIVAEQYIYRSYASGTAASSVSGYSIWITETGDKQNTWSIKRPTYNSSYPVLYVVKQTKRLDGTVITTSPIKDDTTTIIDGGHITTGTIDATKVTVDNIKAENIKSGYISADRINASSIVLSKLASDVQVSISNGDTAKTAIDNLQIGGRNLFRDSGDLKPDVNYYNTQYLEKIDDYLRLTPDTSNRYLYLNSQYLKYSNLVDKTITLSFEIRKSPVTSEYTNNPSCVVVYGFRNDTEEWNRTWKSDTDKYKAWSSFSVESEVWTKKSFVASIPEDLTNGVDTALTDTSYFFINARAKASTPPYDIRHIKLEFGNIATDWTPAPEDFNNDISYLTDSVSALQETPLAYYGICSTASSNVAKEVTCKGFKLVQGAIITVYHTKSNISESELTLNVNNTGAKTVYTTRDEATSATNQLLWNNKTTITYIYDGTNWCVADNPGSYVSTECTTAEATKAKAADANGKTMVVYKGASVTVPMKNANTNAEATLNVSGLGAKPIYYGSGSNVPTKANAYSWLAGSSVIFVFDGANWRTGNQTFIDANGIITGYISADRIQANSLGIGVLNTETQNKINAGNTAKSTLDSLNLNTITWIATCPTAAATAAKVATITPATTNFTLQKGVSVDVTFSETNSAAVGSITLNVNGTGAKNIKFVNNTGLSNIADKSHLATGLLYHFVYDGTYWVIQNYNYNTDTYNRIRQQSNITASADITSGKLICGDGSGYRNVAAGVEFDLSYPILYAASTVAVGATSSNNYLVINGINYATTGTIDSPNANKLLYLVGTVTDNVFKIKSDKFFTTNVPTSEDGYYYIPLGVMYNTTSGPFNGSKTQLYAYIDGAFQPVDTAAKNVAVSALNAATLYGTCDTAYGTATKIVTCDGFKLKPGVMITVKFTVKGAVTNTVSMNVNNTGVKNVYVAGAITSNTNQLRWGAGAFITFRYDGENYVVVGEPRSWFAKSSTAATTAAKTDNDSAATGIVICKGTIANVTMANKNNVANPTLNIQGTGGIPIHSEDGALSAASAINWSAKATVAFIFNGSGWDYDGNGARKAAAAYSEAQESAKTATDYLTFITGTGLDVGYSGSNAKTRISTNGIELFGHDGSSLGSFQSNSTDGALVRVGKSDIPHVEISPTTFSILSDSTNKLFNIDALNEIISLGDQSTNGTKLTISTNGISLGAFIRKFVETSSGGSYQNAYEETFAINNKTNIKIGDASNSIDSIAQNSLLGGTNSSIGRANDSLAYGYKCKITTNAYDTDPEDDDTDTRYYYRGRGCIALGVECEAITDREGTIAIGYKSKASGSGIAIGRYAEALGSGIALGGTCSGGNSVSCCGNSYVNAQEAFAANQAVCYSFTGFAANGAEAGYRDKLDEGLDNFIDRFCFACNDSSVYAEYAFGCNNGHIDFNGKYAFAANHATTDAKDSFACNKSTINTNADYAFAANNATASNAYSAAFGNGSEASGQCSVTFGKNTKAQGSYSAAFGYGTSTSTDTASQLVCGEHNSPSANDVFEIGWGTSSTKKNIFSVRTTGAVYSNSTQLSSDIRVKTNILDLDKAKAVEFIKTLQPKSYEKNDIPELGFIAQEVEETEYGDILVSESENYGYPDFKSLNYTALIAPTIAALQNALERIDILETKVSALEEQNELLKEIINRMKD